MTRRLGVFAATCLALTLAATSAPVPAQRPVHRFTLDNGLVGLVRADTSAPLVSIQMWIASGSDDEAEYLGSGLTHFIEHMVFKGTPTRKPGEIARAIDGIGGTINAYTANDRTVFFVDLPADEWQKGLAILADALQNTSFPEEEWKKEREVILRELAMCRDDPNRRIGELLMATAFRVHPSRFPVIGRESLFRALTRDDLVGFYHRRFVPDNLIVAVVGAVIPGEVEAAVRHELAGFKPRPVPPVAQPIEPEPIGPRLARETGPYEIGRIEWAYPTIGIDHPDAPVLDVLATLAGIGDSSRLVRQIKEDKSLATSISAWSSTPRSAGLFGISATFEPANESNLVNAIQQEIETWRTTPFPATEVDKARRIALTRHLDSLQTMSGQAFQIAAGEFYAYDPSYSDFYLQRIDRVTPDDLLAVARKYLAGDRRCVAILIPGQTNAHDIVESAPAAGPVAKSQLPNNVPLITREDHRLPLVWFCVSVGGGLLYENENNYGISCLLSELLLKGTKKFTAPEIAGQVDNAGATLASYSGYNTFGIEARCLASDASQFAELIADCLLNPDFATNEIEKQKARQVADIEAQRESPVFLAGQALRKSLFADHPYSLTPPGAKATVQAITRQDLLAFHRKSIVTDNIVISCFGDIATDRARELAALTFKRIPAGTRPALEHEPAAPHLPTRSECKAQKEQAIFMAGFPGLDLNDPGNDALLVLTEAMNGLSSDIMVKIRDKEGLAYFVHTFHQEGIEPGFIAICSGTMANALPRVETLVMDELARLANKGLRADEFERARCQLKSERISALQMNGNLARECATEELLGRGFEYSINAANRLAALTPASVREIAGKLFKTNRMAISIVFPETPQPKQEAAQ